jgi:Tfp pilus assembly protein PilF
VSLSLSLSLPKQARKHYKRAVTLNPGHADALGNYAVLLHCSLREHEEADKQYQLALEADPYHANNHGK